MSGLFKIPVVLTTLNIENTLSGTSIYPKSKGPSLIDVIAVDAIPFEIMFDVLNKVPAILSIVSVFPSMDKTFAPPPSIDVITSPAANPIASRTLIVLP